MLIGVRKYFHDFFDNGFSCHNYSQNVHRFCDILYDALLEYCLTPDMNFNLLSIIDMLCDFKQVT